MAITPAVYDMTVQRRSDHNIQLVFKDSNNDAIDWIYSGSTSLGANKNN